MAELLGQLWLWLPVNLFGLGRDYREQQQDLFSITAAATNKQNSGNDCDNGSDNNPADPTDTIFGVRFKMGRWVHKNQNISTKTTLRIGFGAKVAP